MRLPSFAFGWFQRLSRRERVLTLVVAGTVFVILNLLALNFLIDTYGSLTRQWAEDRRDVLRQRFLANQQAMWTQRNDWLKATQPVLTNRDRAGTALYEQIQGLARARQVMVTSLQIKPAGFALAATPVRSGSDAPQAVTVEADTQGDWTETIRFLATIQQPENFLVFDSARLSSNPADPKQMKGHFLISKWYAPAGK